MAKAKGKKTKKLKIDFTGVEKEIRQRGKRIPEGDYVVKITKGEVRKTKDGSGRYLSWTFQIVEDSRGGKKYAGVPLYYVTSLKPEALFNLRNLIFSASDGKKNVAGKAIDFDPTSLYGKKIGVTVEDDEYEGKIKSKPVDVMPLSQMVAEEDDTEEEDDDTEEEDEDDDEDEEEEDDEDEDDEDEDDLDDVDDDDL